MQIRPANLKDVEPVLALDHSFVTEQVWQLSVRDESGERSAQLRLSPLPRPVRMAYPLAGEVLRRVVHRCDYLWVAHDGPSGPPLGYLGMTVMPGMNSAWLPCGAVTPASRRSGIGAQLLATAITQARTLRLHSVVADVQTKNSPATRFLEAANFKFSGYADNYYATQDIALLYSYRVR